MKIPGSERVIDDKTTTHHTTRESREENIKMHDEDERQLDNIDGVHRLALTGNEVSLCDPNKFKGKVTHYRYVQLFTRIFNSNRNLTLREVFS